MTTSRFRSVALCTPFAFSLCAAALAASLGGCSGASSPALSTPSADDPVAETAAAERALSGGLNLPPTSTACPATRWIAYHPAARCVDASYSPHGRWVATHVFDTAAGTAPSASIPPGLGYFCSYDWVSSAGTPPDLASLPKLDARSSIGPDCMAVSALAPASLADAPEIWGPLRTKMLAQSGVTRLAPTSLSGTPARAIRIAVVDSAPGTAFDGQAGLEGRYAHGHNVGRLVRELTCPDDGTGLSACIGRVSNHLALPMLDETHEDRVHGGFFGRQSDLAAAIREAASAPPSSSIPTSHTVINLSVGWDSLPGYGGAYSTPADLQPPARAVHAALVHAACINVLTFAAAGNRTYGAASLATKGAMYPAAWEAKRAPTVAECVAMEGPGYTPPGGIASATIAPLVYAVGGLDARDMPLENSRELGRPKLNAYGFAVVSSNLGGGHTDPMTGTSMATATASAAASVIWSYKPELTPREVVSLMLASSAPLANEQADFCYGAAPCGNASRISVGAAYARAQCNVDAVCAANLFAKPVPYSGKNPSWTTSWATAIPGGVDRLAEAKPCTDPSAPSCADPTANAKTKEATPWVQPQPGAHGCDICGLGGSELYVTLDPSVYMNTQLGYLTLYGANPNATIQYVIPVPAGARTFSVGNVVAPVGGTTSAALSFKVAAPSGTFVTHEQIPAW